jgi:indole-3-acetate monooxygenase
MEADVVVAAKELVPLIRAHQEDAERLRRQPSEVAEALAAAGLLQMYLPRSMGGQEHPPLTAFRAIETLSRADGSTGWCAMIASSLSAFMGWMPAEPGRFLTGGPPDFRGAGSVRAMGRARPVEGGWLVSGRWDFASGLHHARWLNCTCVVMQGDAPQLTPAGTPLTRTMWVPASAATILDTWSVVGLRATGSHDFAVHDVFVPAAHSYSLADPPRETGTLYHPRMLLISLWTPTAANALGIARGAIDAFVAMAGRASSTMSTALLRDRPMVQTRVAQATAIVRAARAYVLSAVGCAWAAVGNGMEDPGPMVADARLAIVHAMHQSVRAVDLVFHAAGTNAVYSRNPLERYFRDVHVAVQHAAGLPGQYESAGKVLLGLRPMDPGW